MENIDIINSLIQEYFQFKDRYLPYKGGEWKTNGEVATQCKAILDRLAVGVNKFIRNSRLGLGDYDVYAARGVTYYPRAPWIGVFFDEEEPTNGVYPVISFFEDNSGFYISCVESVRTPQPGFSAEFCNFQRQRLAQMEMDQSLLERELEDAEHIAFPAYVFRRGEVLTVSRFEIALKSAIQIYAQYRKRHKRESIGGAMAQQDASREMPRTVGDLFSQFEIVKKSLDELAGRQKRMAETYESSDREAHRMLAFVEDVKKQAYALDLKVTKACEHATSETDKATKDAERRIQELIDSRKVELDKLRQDASDLLEAATAGALGLHFDKQAKAAGASFLWRFWGFVGCLCGLVGVGLYSIFSSDLQNLNSAVAQLDVVRLLVLTVMKFVAFYIPTLWLTCHLNKSAIQAKRLKEEYVHKGVVAKTYVGLSKQVEELISNNVDAAKKLEVELLGATISVLSANPNYVFDKAKTSMPISVLADDISKVADSASKIIRPSN